MRRVGYALPYVDIPAGEVTSLDFALTPSALNLDPIVATGDQRKIELGTSVSTIDAATRVEETPITPIADLHVAKAPGVIVGPPNMTRSAP